MATKAGLLVKKTIGDAIRLTMEDWQARGVCQSDMFRASALLSTDVATWPLEGLTPHRLRLWLLDRRKEGRKPGGIAKIAQVLTRALRLAHEEEWIEKLIKCPKPKAPPARVDHFTPAEMTGILSSMPIPVYRDLVQWIFLTACRSGEARMLKWRDVTDTQDITYVAYKHTKTGVTRELPLSETLVEILVRRQEMRSVTHSPIKRRLIEHAPSDFVFHNRGRPISGQALLRQFRLTTEELGYKDRRIHDLRRSGITFFMNAGVPAHIAMRISGHRSARQFFDYCQSRPEDLYNALETTEDQLHGRKGRFRFHMEPPKGRET